MVEPSAIRNNFRKFKMISLIRKFTALYKWAHNYFIVEAHFGSAVSDTFADRWSKRLQVLRLPTAVFAVIASYEEKENLKSGDTVDRPYMTALFAKTLPSTGAISRHDLTITGEKLTVDQKKEVSYFVQDYERIQASIKFTDTAATHVGKVLINQIDGAVLGEYENADSKIGAYEMAGTGSASDGIGFTASISNVLKVFTTAKKKLNRLDIPQNDRWAAISGEFESILLQYLAGKDTNLGDATGQNGHIGKFMNFKLYLSNACAWSGSFLFNAVMGEDDTLVVNGVTFTWNGTIGATEGDCHILGNATLEAANAAAALNAPDTSIAGSFIPFTTAAYLKALEGITASSSDGTLTLVVEGKGYIAVSDTADDADSLWDTTKQIQHQLFGQGRPVDLVIQKFPKIEVQVRSGYIGRDFITWDLYGLKTFDEGDAQMVDVQTLSGAF